MEAVISKMTDLLAAYPGAAMSVGVAVLCAGLVWAVLASSYRYR